VIINNNLIILNMKTIILIVSVYYILSIATCTRVAKKYPETREQLNEFAGKFKHNVCN